jgi:hypothetical protein
VFGLTFFPACNEPKEPHVIDISRFYPQSRSSAAHAMLVVEIEKWKATLTMVLHISRTCAPGSGTPAYSSEGHGES